MLEIYVFCSIMLVPPTIPGSDDQATLNALAGLYEENRSKFDAGQIWFEFIDGKATDIDAASSGTITDAHRAEGFYAFRGDEAIYRCIFPDASMVATSSRVTDRQVTNRLQCVRTLTNGKATLREDRFGTPEGAITRAMIINPGAEAFFRSAAIPLGLGHPESVRDDPWRTSRLIQDRSDGLTLGSIRDDEVIEGVKVVRVVVTGPGGTRQMWLDPTRGAIPLRVHDEMPGGRAYDLRLGDVRMVAGRGWFPFERTELLGGARVMRMVVTKVDFGPVPEGTFRLEFPEPVAMVNLEQGVSYPPRKVWDLARLPAANAPGVNRLNAPGDATAPMLPVEIEPSPYRSTAIALGVAAVVGFVGYFWRRRSRRAS